MGSMVDHILGWFDQLHEAAVVASLERRGSPEARRDFYAKSHELEAAP
jgi:hypothetical protein